MIKVAELSIYPEYFVWNFVKDSENFNFKKYIEYKLYVYDCDEGNSKTYYYVVMNDGVSRFYKVYHEYYWHDYGKEEAHVENIFEITEISKEMVKDEYGYCGTNLKMNLKKIV